VASHIQFSNLKRRRNEIEDYHLSDIRVHGISNNRNERLGPVHLHLSAHDQSEPAGTHSRFSDAVFQSARILSRQDAPCVKEQTRTYQPMTAPSIELLYLSKDGDHGIGVTILFHQSGPSVICYSKTPPQKKTSNEQIPLPKMLQSLCIGYENRYSYFTLPNVEKNCRI
jgi:hypothetical protein